LNLRGKNWYTLQKKHNEKRQPLWVYKDEEELNVRLKSLGKMNKTCDYCQRALEIP